MSVKTTIIKPKSSCFLNILVDAECTVIRIRRSRSTRDASCNPPSFHANKISNNKHGFTAKDFFGFYALENCHINYKRSSQVYNSKNNYLVDIENLL